MPRYIDADKMRDNALRMGFHSTTMTISEFINLQPTADVRPVIRGKWIDVNGDGNLWRCDQCKDTACCKGNFCSTCGADMRQIGGDTE